MTSPIDREQFGPWALITGASSGIGREFARQIAAAGINTVLVARRRLLLEELGRDLARDYQVQHRTIEADCYDPDLVDVLSQATGDLDVGLVISNAGTGEPGEFLEHDRQSLLKMARLNALSHLEIAHHFGARLVQRGRGGLLFGGAMGAIHGLPFMAGDSASKAFVQTLGEALHFEFQPRGVNVTVLVIGPTDTAIIQKFGLTPRQMPMKPMTAEQCAREGILALVRNQATYIPGRINRVMNTLMPASMIRRMTDKVLRAGAANAGLAVGEATAT